MISCEHKLNKLGLLVCAVSHSTWEGLKRFVSFYSSSLKFAGFSFLDTMQRQLPLYSVMLGLILSLLYDADPRG